MISRVCPTLLIVLCLLSALGYVGSGDWRKIVYWIAAAMINFVVTY
jgi:hypothetical protein